MTATSPDTSLEHAPANRRHWWATAAAYQIYVRSFSDTTGDGIGDLDGIRSKLPYLATLGLDAIWLCPVYPSPQWDHGYDVADYFGIEADYGTLESFDALVSSAHRHGIRVMMDVVPNHCSWDHAWFKAALAAAPGSPERARFYFSDGRGPNGDEPPNNWISIFAGRAWTRVTEADGQPGQWYLHVFTPQQPDLNWDNPEVPEMFDDMLRFWFDRGVDGFRCDAVTVLGKTPGLPDAVDDWNGKDRRIGGENPHFTYVESGHDAWRRWRQTVDQYERDHPGRELVLVAEAYANGRPDILHAYVNHEEFHQTFAFDFLLAPWNASALRTAILAPCETLLPKGIMPTWTNNNHDAQRCVTRYGRADADTSFSGNNLLNSDAAVDIELGTRRAVAAAMLMLALPGSVYLYAGEELGLPEVLDLPDDARQDPIFLRTKGADIGRDGCRVPLPWSSTVGTSAGFSPEGAAAPWMPQPEGWEQFAADRQESDPNSTLNTYRRVLAERRSRSEIHGTEFRMVLEDDPSLVAFERGRLLVVLNTADVPVRVPDEVLGGRRSVLTRELLDDDAYVPGNSCVWYAD